MTLNGVLAVPQPALIAGGGVYGEGEDAISFAAAPAAGVVVRWSATDARLRYELLYKEGTFGWRHLEGDIWAIKADFLQKVAA